MKAAVHTLLLLLAFTCIGCSDDGPTSTPTTASVDGTLSDARNGKLVVGAKVTLVGANRSVVTGADGKFAFNDVEPRTYKLVLQKDNYGYALTDTFMTAKGEKAKLNTSFQPVMGAYKMDYQVTGDFPGTGTMTLYDDLTWIFEDFNGSGSTGTWTLTEDQITMAAPIEGFQFKGMVGSGMSGTMQRNGESFGSWSAVRE